MPKIIVTKKNIKLNTDFGALKIYPTIENLTVTPSSVQQVFTHPNVYGYDTVTVEAVEADTLNITPTTQSQEYTGLYGTVNVSAVDSSIDNNIQAGNIKKDVNILGITGSYEGTIPINYIDSITVGNNNLLNEEMNMAGIQKLKSMNFSNSPNLKKVFNLNASEVTSLNICFTNDKKLTTLEWVPPEYLTNIARAFESCAEITEINLINTTYASSNVNWGMAFYNCYKLEKIKGILDLTGCTNTGNMFLNNYVLEEVTFKENTIPRSIAFGQSSSLKDNTIISIANGLNESVTNQTLTLHATSKAKCSTIMGTVDSTTYDYKVFVPSESGTISLEEFITIEKGWTLS